MRFGIVESSLSGSQGRFVRGVALGLLASTAILPVSAMAQAASDTGLGEIIVTAQKREQNMQDVPISVTALTGNSLIANRIQNVSDLNAIAPNLSVHSSLGGSQLPSITLRGVVSVGSNPGSDREVSMYIDGVYLANALGSIFDLADIERIEVVKGPQGTLFGRNSTAGAISIVTRDPTGKFALQQQLTVGNFDQFRTKTRVDLPALGPLSATVTYTHSQRSGDTRNLGGGTVWDYKTKTPNSGFGIATSPQRLGDENIDAVSAAAKLDLTDGLDIIYKFDWSENKSTPNAIGTLLINPAGLGPVGGGLLTALLATQPNPSILTPISFTRPDVVNNNYAVPGISTAKGHNLTVKYQILDDLSVKNIAAYREAYTLTGYDLTGYGGLINTVVPSIPGAPVLLYITDTVSQVRQWSDELQLNYNSDLMSITAGLLYFKSKQTQGSPGGAPNGAALQFMPGYVIPNTGLAPAFARQVSKAAYIQGEVHATDKLDVVLGYRVTKDDKFGTSSTPGLPTQFSYSDTKPAYLAGVNYKPNRDILLYAKYSTSYMSGGSSFGLAFLPEIAKSWEGGIKADLLDGRLRTNLAVFTAKYSNLQSATSGTLVGLPQASSVLINSGTLRASGFEFEGTVRPVRGLTMGTGIGYTKTRYLEVNPLVGTIDTYVPYYRPKWTGNFWGQYDTRPLFGESYVSFRLDANYQSRFALTTTLPKTAALAAVATVDHSWLVNGRLSLMDIPIGGSKGQVALWGRNLFDNKKPNYAVYTPFVFGTNYQRERTFGMDFVFDY